MGKYAEKILKKIGFFRYFPLEGQNFEEKKSAEKSAFFGDFSIRGQKFEKKNA